MDALFKMYNLIWLFQKLSLRRILSDPLRSFSTVIAIALTSSLLLAVLLASSASIQSMKKLSSIEDKHVTLYQEQLNLKDKNQIEELLAFIKEKITVRYEEEEKKAGASFKISSNTLSTNTLHSEFSIALKSSIFSQNSFRLKPRASAKTDSLLKAYQTNLILMALLAALASVMFIYSTAQLANLRALNEIKTLYAIGISSKITFSALIIDAIVLGFLGALSGLTLGQPIIRLATSLLFKSISHHFTHRSALQPLGLSNSFYLYTAILLSGPLLCALGAVIPALQSSNQSNPSPNKFPKVHLFIGVLTLCSTVLILFFKPSSVFWSQASSLLPVLSAICLSQVFLSLCINRNLTKKLRSKSITTLLGFSNTSAPVSYTHLTLPTTPYV